ncbi:MAG: hypothetical protein Q9162_005054 [Coniocarpon cinnabarinum]
MPSPETCLQIKLDNDGSHSGSYHFPGEKITGQIFLQQTNFFQLAARSENKADGIARSALATELELQLFGQARLAYPTDKGTEEERWSVNRVYEVSQTSSLCGIVPGSHVFWLFEITAPDRATVAKSTHHHLEVSVRLGDITFSGSTPVQILPFDPIIDSHPREQEHTYEAQLPHEHRHPSNKFTEKVESLVHRPAVSTYKFTAHSWTPREAVVGSTVGASFEVDPAWVGFMMRKQQNPHPKICVKGWSLELLSCEKPSLPGLSGEGDRLSNLETVAFEEQALDMIIHAEDYEVKRVELNSIEIPDFLAPTTTCRHGAETYRCHAELKLEVAGKPVRVHADEPVIIRPKLLTNDGSKPVDDAAAVSHLNDAPAANADAEHVTEQSSKRSAGQDNPKGAQSTEKSAKQPADQEDPKEGPSTKQPTTQVTELSTEQQATLEQQDASKSAKAFAKETTKALDE